MLNYKHEILGDLHAIVRFGNEAIFEIFWGIVKLEFIKLNFCMCYLMSSNLFVLEKRTYQCPIYLKFETEKEDSLFFIILKFR